MPLVTCFLPNIIILILIVVYTVLSKIVNDSALTTLSVSSHGITAGMDNGLLKRIASTCETANV